MRSPQAYDDEYERIGEEMHEAFMFSCFIRTSGDLHHQHQISNYVKLLSEVQKLLIY